MNIMITGRKFNLKDSFRDYAEQKMKKIQRIFGDEADVKITVTVEKEWQTVETTVKKDGVLYRAECSADRMEDALDKTIDDLVRKLRKNRTRIEKSCVTWLPKFPSPFPKKARRGKSRLLKASIFP